MHRNLGISIFRFLSTRTKLLTKWRKCANVYKCVASNTSLRCRSRRLWQLFPATSQYIIFVGFKYHFLVFSHKIQCIAVFLKYLKKCNRQISFIFKSNTKLCTLLPFSLSLPLNHLRDLHVEIQYWNKCPSIFPRTYLYYL